MAAERDPSFALTRYFFAPLKVFFPNDHSKGFTRT